MWHNEKRNSTLERFTTMDTHHISPVENTTITGMCIDADNTKSHEDLLRITKQDDTTQIDIAVVIPPIKIVGIEKLHSSLNYLITSSEKQQLFFLDLASRIRYGFNDTFPRTALVATYIIDTRGELIFEELMLSQAIGIMRSFSQYASSSDNKQIIFDLKKVLTTKPGVESHVRDLIRKNIPKSYDPGYQTTLMATQLFNLTCRNAANSENIPFIRRPALRHGDPFFVMNEGAGKYSGCLRDPTAFVNASNMVGFLSGDIILPFSREYLMANLPIRRTPVYMTKY
jgi:hypothetical protein